jgi:predicted nucleic acid-binding Zn ribbon protein
MGECVDMNLEGEEDYPDVKHTCEECKEECDIVEETFDYAGTHCNHGQSGIHRTGNYSSKCCDAGYETLLID